MTDIEQFGLELNVGRARAWQALVAAQGFALATGGKVDPAFWEDLADTPEQAGDLAYDNYKSRREARIMAEHGFSE